MNRENHSSGKRKEFFPACRGGSGVLALALSVSLCLGAAAPAFAAVTDGPGVTPSEEEISKTVEDVSVLVPDIYGQKPSAMDEETWARLNDNVLEYSELQDRIMNFNPTIQQILFSIDDSFSTVSENITNYQDAANDFEWLTDQAKSEGDVGSAMMYQINRTIMRRMSSTYIKAEKKKSDTIDRSTKQARKSLLSACQQLMVGYSLMDVNRQTLEKQVELYGAMANMSATQGNIGMATGTEILTAQNNLLSAQSQLTSLTDQMTSMKNTLLLLLGWDYNTPVEFGTIPLTDPSAVDAINFAADKAAAPGQSYNLSTVRNAAPTDFDGDGKYENKDRAAKARTVDQSFQQLSITVDSLYQTLLQRKAELSASDTAFQAAQMSWDSTVRKYQLGMLGRAEYLGAEISYTAAKAAHETAGLNLTQAMLNYYWAINGLGELAEG